MTKMLWSVTTVFVLTVMCLLPDLASAQPPGQRTMARNAWRWHSPVQQGRNFTFNLPGGSTFSPFGGYYGYGGPYGYGAPSYGYGVPFGYGTPFGYDTLYGAPSTYGSDWTPPASQLSIEQAREQYLKNQAYIQEMKQKQREAIEARKEKKAEARRARRMARTEKQPTDLYPRLTVRQMNFQTAEVVWPESLLRAEFDDGRQQIGSSLSDILRKGADEKTARAIRATANQMKRTSNELLPQIGFETYTEMRKFLNSLSVEGYYALENH